MKTAAKAKTKKAVAKTDQSTKNQKATIAKLNLGLYRSILVCLEVFLLGWVALVANNIFHISYELESPLFLIMAVVFFAILLFITLFSRERDMLIMCTVFFVAATIGSAFVPNYAILANIECETANIDCEESVVVYEHRNIYWMKIK